MTVENFDYKEMASSLSAQAEELLPADIPEENRKFIINTIYNFVQMSGEALCEDISIDIDTESAQMICQIIAEWVFHKGVDLARSDIKIDYWEAIMQKISFAIFELAKQDIKENISREQCLENVEEQVNKTWEKCINDLAEKEVISQENADKAKELSNIDEMAKRCNDEKVDFLEKIYNSEAADKTIKKLSINTKNIKSKFECLKEKYENFWENNKLYFNSFIAGCFAVYLCKGVFSFLDKINILSIIAENKSFMYILFVISVALVSAFGWYKINQKAVNTELKKLQNIKYKVEELVNPDNMYDRLGVEIITLHIGQGLLSVSNIEQEGVLLPKIVAMRQKLTEELGYIIPNVRIIDDTELETYEYSIEIRNNVVASGYVYPGKYMVISDQWDDAVENVPDDAILGVEPNYQTQVYWISEEDAKRHKNITAVSSVDVIQTHLREELIKRVEDVLTISDIQKLINYVSKQEPKLYNDIKEHGVTDYDLRKIFINLIRENVSIKDITFVFERLSDFSRFSQEPDILSERLRAAFGRQICLKNVDEEHVLYALNLSPEWEKVLDENCERTELGTMFLINPEQVQDLLEITAMTLMRAHRQIGQQPVILCSPKIRLPLFHLLVRHIPTIVVISFSELITDIKVEAVDTIGEK